MKGSHLDSTFENRNKARCISTYITIRAINSGGFFVLNINVWKRLQRNGYYSKSGDGIIRDYVDDLRIVDIRQVDLDGNVE